MSQTRSGANGTRRSRARSVITVHPSKTSNPPYQTYYTRSRRVKTTASRRARLVSLTSDNSTNASRNAIIKLRGRYNSKNRTWFGSCGVRFGLTSDKSDGLSTTSARRRHSPLKTRKHGYCSASLKRTRGFGHPDRSPDGSRRRSNRRSHQTGRD